MLPLFWQFVIMGVVGVIAGIIIGRASVFEIQQKIVGPDSFDNGTLPRSWVKYAVCRVIGHGRIDPYVSAAGYNCDTCSRCGRQRNLGIRHTIVAHGLCAFGCCHAK